MSDLISRQAAIEALTHKWDGMVTSVFDVLKELPSAEPERRGRWEFIGDQIFWCPECGYTCTQKLLEGWRTSVNKLYLPLCPNCRAYMREASI